MENFCEKPGAGMTPTHFPQFRSKKWKGGAAFTQSRFMYNTNGEKLETNKNVVSLRLIKCFTKQSNYDNLNNQTWVLSDLNSTLTESGP